MLYSSRDLFGFGDVALVIFESLGWSSPRRAHHFIGILSGYRAYQISSDNRDVKDQFSALLNSRMGTKLRPELGKLCQ